jgi:hypothetical protein
MSCSDEDPDGKGRMSVSVRKHQGSEMVLKRLLQVVCRHVSCVDLERRCGALVFRERWSTDWMAWLVWLRASERTGESGGDITAPWPPSESQPHG